MNKIFTIILVILIILLGIKTCNQELKFSEITELNEALNDTLVVWKDKDGLSNAKIQVLETNDTKTFLRLKTKDSVVKELQDLVKSFDKELKRSGSATILKTEIIHDTIFTTKGLTDDGLNLKLPYKFEKKDKWIDCTLSINKDSTIYKLKTNEKYSIVLGEDRQGLFKPRKPFVEVKSMNPYSTVKSLRSYQKTREDKKFSIGPIVGYGIGTTFIPQPFIGVGLQYQLIKF